MGAGVVRRLGLEMGCVYYKGQLGSGCALRFELSLTYGRVGSYGFL